MADGCASAICAGPVDSRRLRRILWLALVINAIMFVVEVAYGVVPAFEDHGYATEAAAAAVEYAFTDDRVRIVRAHTRPENNASTRVLEKCGFRRTEDVVDPDDGPVWRWELKIDVARAVSGSEIRE